jgi:mono/diheme cytochrome c family protein
MQGRAGRIRASVVVRLATLGAVVCVFLVSPPAWAAEKDLTDKGEVLVKKNCSRCHAIGKEGDSPHPEAPPFRTLSSRYPIEDLSESLAEGIVSGHPDMPIFVFRPGGRRSDHRVSQFDSGKACAETDRAIGPRC